VQLQYALTQPVVTINAPFTHAELALAPLRMYIEAGRFGLLLDLFDMPPEGYRHWWQRWFNVSRYVTGKGVEVRLGTLFLSVGISAPRDPEKIIKLLSPEVQDAIRKIENDNQTPDS